MSGEHATLSPSYAHTWAHCPGALAYAARLELPVDEHSADGAAGTCTHRIAERMLRGEPVPEVGETEVHDGFPILVDEERLERAATYAQAVRERGGIQAYEQRLPIGQAIGTSADLWGTADATVMLPDEGILEVHDLKDGNGRVDAAGNPQLELYALGLLHTAELVGEWKCVRMFIHQPRIRNFNMAEMSVEDLRARGEYLSRRAARAVELFGATDNQVLAALNPSSGACQWCKARHVCARRAQATAEAFPMIQQAAGDKLALSDDTIGELLSKREAIEAFFRDLHAEALERAKAGKPIPGFKLAKGREGPRQWADAETAAEMIYDAITADAYERKLISPPVAQKKLSKSHADVWAALQPLIVRSEAPLTLVPASDGRPPIQLDTPEFGAIVDVSDLI